MLGFSRRKRAAKRNRDSLAHREDVKRKLEIIQWSYGEVLDATKHQDDKIGRFLTAIAFLTTGALALMFRSDLLAYQWKIGWPGLVDVGYGEFPLLAWFAGAFYACVLLAVSLLLSSLGAPLRVPGVQERYGPNLKDSRLFFTHIARERGDVWERRWLDANPAEIEKEILGHYVNETHNIAERADGKYARTRIGAAFFSIGLSYLAVSILLAIAGIVAGKGPSDVAVLVRGVLGVILGGHAWLQIRSVVVNQTASVQLKQDAVSGLGNAPQIWSAAGGLRRIQPLCVIYALALLLPGESPAARGAGALLAAGTAIFAVLSTWSRWRPGQQSACAVVERFVEFAVLPGILAGVALLFGGVFPLALAACLPVGLGWLLNTRSVPRLFHRKSAL